MESWLGLAALAACAFRSIATQVYGGVLVPFFAFFRNFFDILTHLKLSCNFLTFFNDFSSSLRGFGMVWGWILGGFSRIFSDYIEKRDFAKISVSPRREHDFQGFEL